MKKIIAVIAILTLSIGVFYSCGKKEDGVVKIGAILPLTGDAAQYGQSGKEGLLIAQEEIKEKNPDFKFEIIVEDDKGNKNDGISAVNKLITKDNVHSIIGAMVSGVSEVIAPIVEKNKVVLMSPTSTKSSLTEAGDYFFRVCVADNFEAKSMTDFINKNYKNKKIGVVYINNAYGVGLSSNFVDILEKDGLKVSILLGYEPKTVSFKTIIQKLINDKIDLVYLVAEKEQLNFFQQCKELNFRPLFTGSTMIEDPDLTPDILSFLDGTFYTYRSYNPQSTVSESKNFVERYTKKFNKAPDFYAASTYDATKVILYTLSKTPNNSESIKDFLYKIKNFQGVTGMIEFDKNGDVTQPFSIKIIKDGKFEFLK
jgi:branched-chain amino acid transport system substrate-binding protein